MCYVCRLKREPRCGRKDAEIFLNMGLLYPEPRGNSKRDEHTQTRQEQTKTGP